MSAFPPDYLRAHLIALGCDLSRVEESFTHSGGAGGQNVNKVATCVQLRYAPANIAIKMQEHRTQVSNRLAARELKRRQNAQRPRGVKRQFVADKRHQAQRRANRKSTGDE